MATLRDMTAQQKQAAELLVTIKGLKQQRATVERSSVPKAPRTPRDAYEAISATYWAGRRPAPMDLILDQYWREREAELSRRHDAPGGQSSAE
jgi:hypothetical protein